MKSLVKKEVRLVLPAWIVAVLLAMVQGITRSYDFYVAWLLFFGLTIMALSTIGREASLNTFSSLLAQPAERIRIWQVKLSVLAVAFLTVLMVWLAAFGLALLNSHGDANERENSYNLFIAICLIATATFTGGLWTTLLLRQLASSFWLTMLVPATLSGFAAVFFVGSGSNSLAIAVLSVVIGLYSLAGFFFARWLYFRAQDVGWSGGVIALPEWQLRSKTRAGKEIRARRPLFALVKKEVMLQQGVLTGAVGLLALHFGIVLARTFHHFQRNSAGEIFSSIFWMLWLMFPVMVGCIAVAEERKLGVMEGQFCVPASRRFQFAVKLLVALFLGILLGGVMPVFVETAGFLMGGANESLRDGILMMSFPVAMMLFSGWLALVSFFASSMAKNFLQSIGFAILTSVVFSAVIPILTRQHMLFFDSLAHDSILSALIGVPTLVVALIWLSWLNFKDYRSGWELLRRSALGAVGAAVFVGVATEAVYNRAWEVFEPAEPAHGPAQLSLANQPVFCNESFVGDGFQFQIQLPDRHLWFDQLPRGPFYFGKRGLWQAIKYQLDPLPSSTGPHVLASKWVSRTELAGIQADGSLWAAGPAATAAINTENLVRYGSETNWQQLLEEGPSVFLLKKDGTLWCWGTNNFNWKNPWPGFENFPLRQIGTNSDWCELYSYFGCRAQKKDGSIWVVGIGKKGGKILQRDTSFEHVSQQDRFRVERGEPFAYARTDGTLWLNFIGYRTTTNQPAELQLGNDTNWVSAAWSLGNIYALKSDGTLWCWGGEWQEIMPWDISRLRPSHMGIHNDWMALAPAPGGVLALAADGSLWLWPDKDISPYMFYGGERPLLKLPKQPKYLGNVLTDKSSTDAL